MKIVKHIVSYEPKTLDFHLFTDGEFLFHGVELYNFRNTFERVTHEHPMEITKSPWVLFDTILEYRYEDPAPLWIFKRENKITQEFIIIKEISRLKIKELGLDE